MSMKRSRFARDRPAPQQQERAMEGFHAAVTEGREVDYMNLPFIDKPHTDSNERCDNIHNNTRDNKRPLSKVRRAEQLVAAMAVGREIAMAVPIGADNKGFHVLSKLGYKVGEGLGKSEQGIITPIPMSSRPPAMLVGVGVEHQLRKHIKEKEAQAMQAVERQEEIAEKFKKFQSSNHEISRITRELKRHQRLIANLDQAAGIGPHGLWSNEHIAAIALAETRCPMGLEHDAKGNNVNHFPIQAFDMEDSGASTADIFAVWEESKEYLRRVHMYCPYCGCGYDSAESFAVNCPGLCEEDH